MTDHLDEYRTKAGRERQVQREKSLRDHALGQRVQSIKDGNLDPVLRRWVNASVVPSARRLKEACVKIVEDHDFAAAGRVLGSPTFGVMAVTDAAKQMIPIMGWMLKGRSPGRTTDITVTTYAEDVVLSVLGYLLRRISVASPDEPVSLNSALSGAATMARETVMGQWITSVQGAGAMARLQGGADTPGWKRKYRLKGVANLLTGQVKPQLDEEGRGEIELEEMGSKKILKVIDPRTKAERRIELRPPDSDDWLILQMAKREPGEADPYASTWVTLALMVLAAAQGELGWFDIGTGKSGNRKTKAKGKIIVLSEAARDAIGEDVEAWTQFAFINAPMLYPPEDGGYLTVKMKKVSAKGAVKGAHTQAEDTIAWQGAADVMAGTTWTVNTDMLDLIPQVVGLPKGVHLGEYKRHAMDKFWLPIYFDFRGRAYYRTTAITYQGSDEQKALLQFTPRCGAELTKDWMQGGKANPTEDALCVFACGLAGEHDKAPLSQQRVTGRHLLRTAHQTHGLWGTPANPQALRGWLSSKDKPATLLALARGYSRGDDELDRIPIQIDGTCNGLQHLSAMFQDEIAAPYVNLTSPDPEEHGPADIYAQVAELAAERLAAKAVAKPFNTDWQSANRLLKCVKIDRTLTKRSVMVLPYGGTLNAVRSYTLESALKQDPGVSPWIDCLVFDDVANTWRRDDHALEMGYDAFAERELADHPLFKRDINVLADIVWDAIRETLPRAMQAMDAFRKIGAYAGKRVLTWRVDNTGLRDQDLWVRQSRTKAQLKRTRLKGFHLPDMVRSLAMLSGSKEVDATYHRTGIVANFIHSHDADHLHRTMRTFDRAGLRDFAAVHDCFATRLSQIVTLKEMTRATFMEKYEPGSDQHPLNQPVALLDPKDMEPELYFKSWYDIAEAAGAEFPEPGTWTPDEMKDSYWFFS